MVGATAVAFFLLGGGAYAVTQPSTHEDTRAAIEEAVGDPPPVQEVFDALMEDAPEIQRTILADGTVTWDEHEGAIASFVQCLEENGVTAEVRPADGKRPTEVGFAASNHEMAVAAKDIYDRCKAEHVGAVRLAWLQQLRPTVDENLAALEWLGVCMASKDVALRGGTVTLDERMSWFSSTDPAVRQANRECMADHEREFGW